MKVVIPAKNSSTRVLSKNFRPFYKGQSLFDIKVSQLLLSFAPNEIYVSSEDPAVAQHAERWGLNFLIREPYLAKNETPYPYVVSEICKQVPGDDDIAWCHLTDPLFNDYGSCLTAWKQARLENDCLVVVYPFRGYLLDENHCPMGFGFGPRHVRSQLLPTRYLLGFTLSLLHRKTAVTAGPIGGNPFWFHATNRTVDIDDETDFVLAQAIYQHLAAG
ncbi:hypothetical protein Mkiyose1665_34240 [Mycobacterium kiyosense]|uniref:cytidylyltransferase domain-containing protein n=1 Tax=Mycobacterium TaxID=1763 RepID=UPI00114E6872|nr:MULTISPECIES: CMP-N-acetylneuraminic acid synthetase [Mycobacterium]MCV7007293.1 CMP-N-acetylneuraminic acid synthetase [Mycobacterium gordonae]GLD42924.1 hypothetical protein Mkiyose1665_34240 [Mycobacterium kiyosense]